jgi:hypothetical protein
MIGLLAEKDRQIQDLQDCNSKLKNKNYHEADSTKYCQ